MSLANALQKVQQADLPTKVGLVLFVVIFPISLLMGYIQSRVLDPILSEEVKQVGLSFAQNVAGFIESRAILGRDDASAKIEDQIQRLIYAQPSVVRVDVITQSPKTGQLFYLASNVEGQDTETPPLQVLKQKTTIELGEEGGVPVYDVYYPVRVGREFANVQVMVSRRFVDTVNLVTLRINLIAALMSTIALILILRFLLRRLLENERQLKVAQQSNQALSERLQGLQQELIHTEKLAVMGQLTASFAHEIGTPLNAVGGHLQLLSMDIEKVSTPDQRKSLFERMGIISSQLKKIEDIVKQFLQTTKKPIAQQKSVVPVRELAEGVLTLVTPTLQKHQISFGQDFRAKADQVEVVPLEIEQVILNLVNNAVDSMRERARLSEKSVQNALWIRTLAVDALGSRVALEIEDSGTGISPENLKQVFKPFFTTKPVGEGHGLGLSICQQIIKSYGGEIEVQSKKGKGTKIRVVLPVSTVEVRT
jgi:signal transduction histidine kinase